MYADDDGIRQVGTLATVTEVIERFEDGRLNVVVEGGERFRLVELTEGRSSTPDSSNRSTTSTTPPSPTTSSGRSSSSHDWSS